ncbi:MULTISPECIES: acetate/propionate family kinase [Lachnospira]|uniref:Acetate kinase n=2 Tax=Lachnospira TaxID=28050 RepID=A0A1H5RPC4_9FIRM|nr:MULTISPECIES: acetate kinase [Lachnospira]MBQ2473317.1 acetate kinase [Lachnospira sp.]MCR5514886.1 acetate kinase [Lachnospira sp.]SDM72855.1 acetate kinase [Lachnospira pectinoschiza]SEF39588.1 acetate kinase [Lachnospira multipara]
MNILVLNCGSSSLKYQLINMDDESVIAKGLVERIGIEGSILTHKPTGKDKYVVETPMKDHNIAVKLVLDALVDPEHGVIKSTDEIGAVGHRVLHAGEAYKESCLVTEDVKRVIKECFDLGPLHNPANLIGIEAVEAAMPGKKNIAVWDTAFGGTMEPKAYLYAIPREYYEKYHVRRYGFHGTSHMFVSGETIKFAGLNKDNAKVIVCHLGNGASISASIGGKCVDTSMGLTPLEGLIMGTRSGDLDPAILEYLCNHENMTISEMLNVLNKKSGILGMSGISSDFRDLIAEVDKGNQIAKDTLDAYAYRVAKYIGSYVAAMNGVDAIAFTAGVGENNARIRKMILSYFNYLGIEVDDAANEAAVGETKMISTADSKVKVVVLPTNEELAIARDTLALVK